MDQYLVEQVFSLRETTTVTASATLTLVDVAVVMREKNAAKTRDARKMEIMTKVCSPLEATDFFRLRDISTMWCREILCSIPDTTRVKFLL